MTETVIICEHCKATKYCSKECQVEDFVEHKQRICDPFISLISQAKKDGFVYLGPSQEQVRKLDPYPTTPRFISFHMFQKPNGEIITMRLFEKID
jgi:hypothetical protein